MLTLFALDASSMLRAVRSPVEETPSPTPAPTETPDSGEYVRVQARASSFDRRSDAKRARVSKGLLLGSVALSHSNEVICLQLVVNRGRPPELPRLFAALLFYYSIHCLSFDFPSAAAATPTTGLVLFRRLSLPFDPQATLARTASKESTLTESCGKFRRHVAADCLTHCQQRGQVIPHCRCMCVSSRVDIVDTKWSGIRYNNGV